jgi:hypothetical protein
VGLQTGAAKVRMDGIINLYMVTLLDCVSAECRAWSGRYYRIGVWLNWRRCAGTG